MIKKYDAVVIGAGNAGLTCAATMAKNGLSVIVLERNNVPGGSATSFRRGRFEFEPSLHELASVGTAKEPGSVYRLFDSYGIEIDWQYEKNAFRVIADGDDGYDVTMPSGAIAFAEEMEKQVPGSYDSTLAAFELADRVNKGFEYLGKGKPDPAVLMSEHADFLCAVSHSVDACLDALGMPQKAQNIFKTYWPYLGSATNEIDFAHYIAMVDSYIKRRPAMPKDRSHELSLALEKAIVGFGGEIRYNTPVERILIKDNKAYGVIAGGEEILADHIVANCWPDIAYSKLMDPDTVPKKAMKLAGARQVSSLFIALYLGLNRSAEELGIEDYSVFLFDSPDSLEQYRTNDSVYTSIIVANCLNCVIPDSSPEGTCTLFISGIITEKAWQDVRPEDYKKLKNRIAKRLIDVYEKKLGISVTPYIEEIAIAAPPTFARYLGTPAGTPYGYEHKSWDTMLARMMNSKNEQFIDNLYFVGAHGDRGDGYSSTYANGNSVGARISREVKKNV